MSQQTETLSCECGGLSASLCLPVSGYVKIDRVSAGERTWESDWFAVGASSAHDFLHNLDLDSPWLCKPSIVLKAITEINGWTPGEIIFQEGMNYNGDTANLEKGWMISLARNSCRVAFGNSLNPLNTAKFGGYSESLYGNFHCKLVISY